MKRGRRVSKKNMAKRGRNRNDGIQEDFSMSKGKDPVWEDNISQEDQVWVKYRETIFGNYVILTTIFDYLSPEELKICREVTRKWNSVATSILLAKATCFLRLDFTDRIEAYRAKLRNVPNPYEEIKEILQNSQKFPTSSWVLSSSHSLMEDLSSSFGHMLKSLTLLTIESVSPFQNIMELLPNLEKLIIGKINLNKESARRLPKLDSDTAGLQNLRALSVVEMSDEEENSEFFRDLLRNCSRLQTVQVIAARLVVVLLEEGKLGLVKKALLRPCQYTGSAFATIAQHTEPLEEITVDCGKISPDRSISLDRIFDRSREILRKLKVFPLVFFEVIAPHQIFPNLEYLTFEDSAAAIAEAQPGFIAQVPIMPQFVFPFFLMWYQMLDNELNIPEDIQGDGSSLRLMKQDVAPRLKVIKFESKVLLINFGKLPSVTTVEISCPWKRCPSFKQTFPNLKILSLKNTQIQVARFNKFQFWKRLPDGLELLDFYQDTFDFLQNVLCFDQVFTGGTNAKWLLKNEDRIGLAVSIGSSSILCIPNLKAVRIIFDDKNAVKSSSFLNRLKLSTHAYDLAFRFLPKTQLVIAYDRSPEYGVSKELDASFKEMVPFARFEHYKWAGKVKCHASCCVEF
ncbi:unnamed protein product [Allacma fusca]|uniref:F-box domain-containing protein n=1 Tax=Allacma fusca TaxID=39272 RepID=A0A8J2PI62_9HEXA|nr:unnamed protein product [Allacma fusca]